MMDPRPNLRVTKGYKVLTLQEDFSAERVGYASQGFAPCEGLDGPPVRARCRGSVDYVSTKMTNPRPPLRAVCGPPFGLYFQGAPVPHGQRRLTGVITERHRHLRRLQEKLVLQPVAKFVLGVRNGKVGRRIARRAAFDRDNIEPGVGQFMLVNGAGPSQAR